MLLPASPAPRLYGLTRWDVNGHLQGYGRSVEVHFDSLGYINVRLVSPPWYFSLRCRDPLKILVDRRV